jgi:drug/metabolite transporter superfamily protein YnfA
MVVGALKYSSPSLCVFVISCFVFVNGLFLVFKFITKKKSQIILCHRGYRSHLFCCFHTRTLSIATGLIMWSEAWGRVFVLITNAMVFFSS